MIARVAHTCRLPKAERYLAISYLEMAKRIECCCLQLREEVQQREVSVHPAYHRFHNRTSGVTLAMREPAVVAPPLILSCSGNPNRVFSETVECLDQRIAKPFRMI